MKLTWVKRKTLQKKVNEKNWREHPERQVAALQEVLAKVGWADAVVLNTTTDRIVDGHARVLNGDPDEKVPVLRGAWTEQQEDELLTILDPITEYADVNRKQLESLIEEMADEAGAVGDLFDELAAEHSLSFNDMKLDIETTTATSESPETLTDASNATSDTESETENEDDFEADWTPSGGMEASGQDFVANSIKMIQAVFEHPHDQEFRERCERLAGRFETDNLSDTTLSILADQAQSYEGV